MLNGVHHIAYTLTSLERYRPFFLDVLGLDHVADREMPEAGYRATVCRAGEVYVELQEPIDDDEKEQFLEDRGSGLNHVAFEVEDMDAALETLEASGVSSEWPAPVDAPTFPGCKLIDMDLETTDGIFVQLVEDPTSADVGEAN